MVSKRNFISIIIMMLTLVFMFQATQFYYEYIAETETNAYFSEQVISGINTWKSKALDWFGSDSNEPYVLFVGKEDGAVGNSVEQWCDYTKRKLVVCDDLNTFKDRIGKNQEYVLIESACLDLQSDLNILEQFAEAGVNIIFCDLPEVGVLSKSAELQNMLGIQKIENDCTEIEAIRLFSGFLLGGEMLYSVENELLEEYPEVPWYQLNAGAQTYMVGLLNETDMETDNITREMLPALMWSYSDGNCQVFAVNGDYMHDNTGVGILSAIDAKLNEYTLYPILNAQLLTVANYPGLANENNDVVKKLFSGNIIQSGRDMIFPQIVATASQTSFVMSCMLQTQYDYHDENYPEMYAFKDYTGIMKKINAEMGLSLVRMNDVSLSEKLTEDNLFFNKFESRYLFGAAYSSCDDIRNILENASQLDSIHTIVCNQAEENDLISFANEHITVQSITNDASLHSFRSDLYMRSVQTALGYTNVLIDLNRAFWPEEDEISWEKLSKLCADNLYTYWRNFQIFDDVTVSQNDQKIRQLLTMDYSHVRKGNMICLEVENTEQPVNFILRLHNMKPEYIEGGNWTELENGVFLITASEQNVNIHLISSNPIYN